MNVIKSRFVYHLMAIITVAIWGTTFVSTKILIQHGLSPSDIFFYRFTLAIFACGVFLIKNYLPIE